MQCTGRPTSNLNGKRQTLSLKAWLSAVVIAPCLPRPTQPRLAPPKLSSLPPTSRANRHVWTVLVTEAVFKSHHWPLKRPSPPHMWLQGCQGAHGGVVHFDAATFPCTALGGSNWLAVLILRARERCAGLQSTRHRIEP